MLLVNCYKLECSGLCPVPAKTELGKNGNGNMSDYDFTKFQTTNPLLYQRLCELLSSNLSPGLEETMIQREIEYFSSHWVQMLESDSERIFKKLRIFCLEWNISIQMTKNQEMPNYGKIYKFSRIPKLYGGVYVVTFRDEILYIGKTNKSFADRWRNHHIISPVIKHVSRAECKFFEKIVKIYFIPKSSCRWDVRITEAILIHKLKPLLNKRG